MNEQKRGGRPAFLGKGAVRLTVSVPREHSEAIDDLAERESLSRAGAARKAIARGLDISKLIAPETPTKD